MVVLGIEHFLDATFMLTYSFNKLLFISYCLTFFPRLS